MWSNLIGPTVSCKLCRHQSVRCVIRKQTAKSAVRITARIRSESVTEDKPALRVGHRAAMFIWEYSSSVPRCTANVCVRGVVINKMLKEMLYLTTHSTHFIYGYIASDIR